MKLAMLVAAGLVVTSGCRGGAPVRRVDPPAAEGARGANLVGVGDALLATWVEKSAGGQKVCFAQLGAGGWSAPSTVAEGARIVASWADVPSVTRGQDGVLVAHWAEASEAG